MIRDLPQRLQRYIDVDLDGCWLWTGAKQVGGYGTTRHPLTGRQTTAHRVIYELLRGRVPDGLQLDHLCRVRHCVNPEHLEPVTPLENSMRSDSPARVNAEKTTCSHGHPYSAENTIHRLGKHGRQRVCRECEKARHRAYRARAQVATR